MIIAILVMSILAIFCTGTLTFGDNFKISINWFTLVTFILICIALGTNIIHF